MGTGANPWSIMSLIRVSKTATPISAKIRVYSTARCVVKNTPSPFNRFWPNTVSIFLKIMVLLYRIKSQNTKMFEIKISYN
jgi:hypothetical protein